MRGVVEWVFARGAQQPEIAAACFHPGAGTRIPVLVILVMPADQANHTTVFAKMCWRFSQNNLRHAVTFKPRILKHESRLRRNNEGRIRDDEIEFFIGNGLEKASL